MGRRATLTLQALPIDKIKIDAGFVRDMDRDEDSRKIVAAVIGLGHSLGLPTVAEGIEDDAVAASLRLLGCDVGQGYLFGRPMGEVEANMVARFANPLSPAVMTGSCPSFLPVRTV